MLSLLRGRVGKKARKAPPTAKELVRAHIAAHWKDAFGHRLCISPRALPSTKGRRLEWGKLEFVSVKDVLKLLTVQGVVGITVNMPSKCVETTEGHDDSSVPAPVIVTPEDRENSVRLMSDGHAAKVLAATRAAANGDQITVVATESKSSLHFSGKDRWTTSSLRTLASAGVDAVFDFERSILRVSLEP